MFYQKFLLSSWFLSEVDERILRDADARLSLFARNQRFKFTRLTIQIQSQNAGREIHTNRHPDPS